MHLYTNDTNYNVNSNHNSKNNCNYNTPLVPPWFPPAKRQRMWKTFAGVGAKSFAEFAPRTAQKNQIIFLTSGR